MATSTTHRRNGIQEQGPTRIGQAIILTNTVTIVTGTAIEIEMKTPPVTRMCHKAQVVQP